ncbi:hypothetical protein KKA77_00860 [Patescibacteria group bacterium]|nr:hypothetical protein [Patescibacteria group bacterium]MBU1783118.1 hypothetical protein [Patescibacteria group bacterium]MBU2081283.1 hypothetical protein [Patescibacteria group bacterium]MBU2214517.1 hypothetical protein [Patescibacteria group bacterium]
MFDFCSLKLKEVFEKNHEKRVDFGLKIMREYYDFLPFIKEYNKAYLERELALVKNE